MLLTIVAFVVLLIILIFVHELGHFLAAKATGVRVEQFSLGFPPKLFSKKIGETEYQLAWLPIGGYVKLFGETPGEEVKEEDKPRSFSHKPFWVKSVIVLAGPFFNVFFAILVLWLLTWVMGVRHAPPTLGILAPESPLARAGLMTDDVVTSFDGKPVTFFDELGDYGESRDGSPAVVTVRRGDRTLSFEVTPERKTETTVLGDVENYWWFGFSPRNPPRVGQVIRGKPARAAGIRRGDLILSVNGTDTKDWTEVLTAIRKSSDGATSSGAVETASGDAGADETAGSTAISAAETEKAPASAAEPAAIRFTVKRGDETLAFDVVPELEPLQDYTGKTTFTPMVGISLDPDTVRVSVGPIAAFGGACRETYRMGALVLVSLKKLIRREISPKVMGGPIMIAEVAGQSIRSGFDNFIWLMAFISVNLAILNLIPLPVLDGGQFLIFCLEFVKRSPISMKIKEVTQLVGITALVALMIFVFYNDIARLVTRHSGPAAVVEKTE
ncbi:MAG: RIP metalloprotease RseP [Deltaproteobacteria bacterium]|jgi:regulator of sigma E protease|nr:RIP metalloprotease RseP [Deltaproteobacteria bacterium]